MSDSTRKLSDAGVSIWLDDLSRDRLTSGSLAELISAKNVVGVTTNPTIFAGALSKGAAYAEQMRQLAASGADVEEAVFALTTYVLLVSYSNPYILLLKVTTAGFLLRLILALPVMPREPRKWHENSTSV